MMRRMFVTSPTGPPPLPSAPARTGPSQLGVRVGPHRSDGSLRRVLEPALRGRAHAFGVQLEQVELEPPRKIVARPRGLELGHGPRAGQRVVLVLERPVLHALQLLRPLPRI